VIEEYRVAGQLRVVKITPRRGRPITWSTATATASSTAARRGPISPVQYKLFEW